MRKICKNVTKTSIMSSDAGAVPFTECSQNCCRPFTQTRRSCGRIRAQVKNLLSFSLFLNQGNTRLPPAGCFHVFRKRLLCSRACAAG